MNITIISTVCVIFSIDVYYTSAQNESPCFNTALSKRGTCVPLIDCPAVQGGEEPQNCQSKDKIPLVCCVGERKTTRKSQEMCKQYEAEVKKLLNGNCSHLQNYVTPGRGIKAKSREFPHMVAVGFKPEKDSPTQYNCGGIIISRNFILTAAHCLYTRSLGSPTSVRVGDLVLNSDKDDAQPQEIKVSSSFMHPDYKIPNKYNDIALLKLEEDIKFTVYSYPACLPKTGEVEDGSEVVATGWGTSNLWDEENFSLTKEGIVVIPHKNCTRFFKSERRLEEGINARTHICAGIVYGGKDSCRGDSGGPLQKRADEFCMYTVLGVTSFGMVCGLSQAPDVYTNVFPYIDWIENNVWP